MISHTIGWYVTDQNLKVSINSEKPITILMYNIASYKEFKIFFFFFLNLMAEEALPKNWSNL
jgi:hypothetical protein